MTSVTRQPRTTRHPRIRADLVVLGIEVVLAGAAVLVGAVLNDRRIPIHAGAAPLYAAWLPHIGPGTPFAVGVAVLVITWGPAVAARLSWRRLLGLGYLTALAWTLSLALVDGWERGLATRLTPQAEYLHDVPEVVDIPAMLAGFSSHILDFQPGSWATHVSGHPPGALLTFVLLDRAGLGGGAPAALWCVAIGATAPVSVAVALRALGAQVRAGVQVRAPAEVRAGVEVGAPAEVRAGAEVRSRAEDRARAALPFLVLFPGAVWVGASADGYFTGVVAAGLALLALGGWPRALLGGLLLGFALYLSYGLVLAGPLALVVLGRGRWRGAIPAGVGVAAVVAGFTASGFWWLTGYHLVVQRYYQGWAADRPYSYWIWADLACLVLSAGPAVGPALSRAAAARRGAMARDATVWLPAAALLAVVAADLSGLSKAEVERIWLPYEIWLLAATAWLPAGHRRGWLTAQALTALVVNHLLLTGW